MITQGLKSLVSVILLFAFYNAEMTHLNIVLLGSLCIYVLIATLRLILIINEQI